MKPLNLILQQFHADTFLEYAFSEASKISFLSNFKVKE